MRDSYQVNKMEIMKTSMMLEPDDNHWSTNAHGVIATNVLDSLLYTT